MKAITGGYIPVSLKVNAKARVLTFIAARMHAAANKPWIGLNGVD